MTATTLFIVNAIKSQIHSDANYHYINRIPVTVNDAVMNRVHYPAHENAKGMKSMVNQPITMGHPEKGGYNTSARDGEAMVDYPSVGIITNTYESGGVWYADAKIKRSTLKAQTNGKDIDTRLENGEDVGVSTGVYFEPNQMSGSNGKGDKYEQSAINQNYDHLALLPPHEAPAGGKDTVMRFNSEELPAITVNSYIPEKEIDDNQFMANLKKLFEPLFGESSQQRYNKQEFKTEEENPIMDRNQMIAALGLATNTQLTDEQLTDMLTASLAVNADMPKKEDGKAKMMAYMRNMGMKDIDENMDDEKMYNAMMTYKKNMGKKNMDDKKNMKDDKKEMKSNADEVPAWAQSLMSKVEGIESKFATNAKNEKDELVEQVGKLQTNALDKSIAEHLPVETLKSHIAANGGFINVNAAGGYAPQAPTAANDFSKLEMPNTGEGK